MSIAVTWAVVSARWQSRPSEPSAQRGTVNPQASAIPTEPLRLMPGPVKGSKDAKVALIEYSDFKCSFCGSFARNTLPALDRKYLQPGKVLLSFQHLPLQKYPFAQQAAEGAECANRQGRFWEMHDALFARQQQQEIDDAGLLSVARNLGLNEDIFAYCLDGEASPFVKEQADAARTLRIEGTPTFFVGSILPDGRVKVAKRITGAQPLRQFEEALDSLLASQPAERRQQDPL